MTRSKPGKEYSEHEMVFMKPEVRKELGVFEEVHS